MADKNPSRALSVVMRIEMMCDFLEHPAINTAVEQAVPVSMPRAPGALGFDIPLWVGLGVVGLWAALDGFSERAVLSRNQCPTCRRRCIAERFVSYAQGKDRQSLEELEDLRHLYAHNYAGEADDEYFNPRHHRHVLESGVPVQLTCGATFDGCRPWLDLPHLREYSRTVRRMLGHFS
jgi:hypothetical protein